MPRLLTLAAVLAAAALVLTSCGESDSVTTSAPIVRIKVDEYRIVPQNITVKLDPARNGRLKIAVRNTGRLTHNLVIQIPPKKFRERPQEVARVKTMQPGEEKYAAAWGFTPSGRPVLQQTCWCMTHKNV